MCQSAPLAAPAAQRLTHELYNVLCPLGYLAVLPGADMLQSDAAAECVTLLRFFQIVVGFLAPLAWQAAAEASLFVSHQEQRAAAGLAPERGISAQLYSGVWGLLDTAIRPQLWLSGWVALGLIWLLAAGTSTPAAAAV